MIHIPIEQRYDRRNQIFHSSAFAIGAAVVGVAAAGASAYVSMSAADKAAKAQGRAAKGLGNDLDEATQIYQQQQDEVARRMNQLDPTKKFQDWSLLGTEDIFETLTFIIVMSIMVTGLAVPFYYLWNWLFVKFFWFDDQCSFSLKHEGF